MNIYIYIGIMALVTYLIRMIPLTLIKKEITNTFVRSFLYYVPYITLSVMTLPAILEATDNLASGIAGFIAAITFAFFGKSLFMVSVFAVLASAGVLVLEMFLK